MLRTRGGTVVQLLVGLAAFAAVRAASPLAPRQELDWSYARCLEFAQATQSDSAPGRLFECAWFSVPLDYADPTVGNTQIALIRLRSSSAVKKGSILSNPGGPGASGIDFLVDAADRMRSEAGDDWDFVSFAPRAVAPSGPDYAITRGSVQAYIQFATDTYPPDTVGGIGNLTTEQDAAFLLSQADPLDAELRQLDRSLAALSEGNLKYVGTAATVRDMVAIVDALDGPGAPVLGMHLIQMFTDRVGKVILNGVVDPRFWANRIPSQHPADAQIADTESVYRGFRRVCAAAGPRRCAIAREGDTEDTIDERIQRGLSILQRSFDQPADQPFLNVAGQIFTFLYQPQAWAQLAQYLLETVPGMNSITVPAVTSRSTNRNWTNVPPRPPFPVGWYPNLHLLRRQTEDDSQYREGLSLLSISCGDTVSSGATTQEVLREVVRTAQQVSSNFGAIFGYTYFCNTWSTKAVEQYTGPWNAKPKNPVLVISTEADPITPFKAAQLVASTDYLGSSARLIKVWNYGHSSWASRSECASNITFNYFNHDLVPDDRGTNEEDVVCPTETSLLGTDPSIRWVREGETDGPDYDVPNPNPSTTSILGSKPTKGPGDAASMLQSNYQALFIGILAVLWAM